MRFGFTEEQEMIREMAARFAEREVTQQAGSLDEAERFDRYGYDKMAELGFTGLPWPESDGGSGAGFVSFVIVLEELSSVHASIAAALWSHVCLAAWPVYRFGQQELKQRYWRKNWWRVSCLELACFLRCWESAIRFVLVLRPGQTGDGYVLEGLQKYVFGGSDADVFCRLCVIGG